MDDFPNPKALADHLQHLMDSPDEYMRLFEWRMHGWARLPWNNQYQPLGKSVLKIGLL